MCSSRLFGSSRCTQCCALRGTLRVLFAIFAIVAVSTGITSEIQASHRIHMPPRSLTLPAYPNYFHAGATIGRPMPRLLLWDQASGGMMNDVTNTRRGGGTHCKKVLPIVYGKSTAPTCSTKRRCLRGMSWFPAPYLISSCPECEASALIIVHDAEVRHVHLLLLF